MNRKQVFSSICCMFIFISAFFLFGMEETTEWTQDINILAKTIEHMNGELIEWSLYAREPVHLTNEDWKQTKSLLEKEFPQFDWVYSNTLMTGTWEKASFTIKLQIVKSETALDSPAFLSFEIKGNSWDSTIEKETNQLVNEQTSKLFKNKPQLFSCIKGQFNAENIEIIMEVMEYLQAEKVESIVETDFQSITAHSPFFMQQLAYEDKHINMQLGMRKSNLGVRPILVIGTPILTIEY